VTSGQLKDVKVTDVTMKDAITAKEMLLIGSSVKVAGIVQWDDHKIGNGKPGPIASALLALLEEDMRSGNRLIESITELVPGSGFQVPGLVQRFQCSTLQLVNLERGTRNLEPFALVPSSDRKNR
jgi:hypothetical protein